MKRDEGKIEEQPTGKLSKLRKQVDGLEILELGLNWVENELRASEQNFRNSMDSSPIGIVIGNMQGRVLYSNQAILDIWGYGSAEEIAALPIEQLYSPETCAFYRRLKELDEPLPPNHIVEIIRKDGEIRQLSAFRNNVIWDGETHIQRFYLDITEQKQTEDALKKSEDKFRALVESTSDFIWEIDLNGVYTYCSPQMEKLWGLKPEEMLGKTPFELLSPEDREQAIKAFSALSESLSPLINMEMRSFDRTGRIVFLEISGVPFFDIAGKLCGYRGITRDITERKQAEEALRQYGNIVSSSSDMLALLDKGFKYLAVNAVYGEAFNLTPEQLVGNTVSNVFGEEFFNAVIKPNADRCLSGEEINYQDWFDFPVYGRFCLCCKCIRN